MKDDDIAAEMKFMAAACEILNCSDDELKLLISHENLTESLLVLRDQLRMDLDFVDRAIEKLAKADKHSRQPGLQN